MAFSGSVASLLASPRLYQAYGFSGSFAVAASSAALAWSTFCCASSATPRFSLATAKLGSAASACSKYFCASGPFPWFMCATPSEFSRSASVLIGFPAAAAFCAAEFREASTRETRKIPARAMPNKPQTIRIRFLKRFRETTLKVMRECSFWALLRNTGHQSGITSNQTRVLLPRPLDCLGSTPHRQPFLYSVSRSPLFHERHLFPRDHGRNLHGLRPFCRALQLLRA